MLMTKLYLNISAFICTELYSIVLRVDNQINRLKRMNFL